MLDNWFPFSRLKTHLKEEEGSFCYFDFPFPPKQIISVTALQPGIFNFACQGVFPDGPSGKVD